MVEFHEAEKNGLLERYTGLFSRVFKLSKPALIACLILGSGAAQAKIIYVNKAVTTPGNGTSWPAAYKYLRDALDHSNSNDQIYVAKGTYFPDEGETGIFGDRELSFELKGQTIFGGFAGTGANPGLRNPSANPTILSGAIWDEPGEDIYWSLHVVVINQSSALDGLIVEKGHASGSDSWAYPPALSYDDGGGCYVRAGKTLSLNGCTFRGNRALANGGAIMVADEAGKVLATNTLFENNGIALIYDITTSIPKGGAIKGRVQAANCRFISNTVSARNYIDGTTSLAEGGAVSGNVTADHCEFTGNMAIAYGDETVDSKAIGGAIAGNVLAKNCSFNANVSQARVDVGVSSGGAISGGSVSATSCSFTGNTSSTGKIVEDDGSGEGGGGAIYVSTGKSVLANCVFVKNSSQIRGGAIHCATTANSDSLVVDNCTFLDNGVSTGFKGAAISCGGIVRMLNNIIWCTDDSVVGFDKTNLVHVIIGGALRNSDVNYPTPSSTAPNIVKGGPAGITDGYGGDVFLGPVSDSIFGGDPLFANLADPDGPDNQWGTADDGLRLTAGSSAIVTGRDPRIPGVTNILPKDVLDIDFDSDVSEFLPLDIAGYLRIQQSYVDMGAYEFGNASQAPEIAVFLTDAAELSDGASVAFGSVVKGRTIKKSLTIKNIGTGVLKNFSFTTSGSAAFALKSPTVTSLRPGTSMNLIVSFKPTGKGKYSATALIASNDANESPFDIRLSGTGVLKSPSLKPSGPAMLASLAFPSTASSDLSSAAVVTTSVAADGSKYLVLTVRKSAEWSERNHSIEVSSNLLDWYSGNHHTTTLLNSSTTLSVRDNTPLSKDEKRYIRLR